jgi:hypothetical protein
VLRVWSEYATGASLERIEIAHDDLIVFACNFIFVYMNAFFKVKEKEFVMRYPAKGPVGGPKTIAVGADSSSTPGRLPVLSPG